jgi:hypothetical protein
MGSYCNSPCYRQCLNKLNTKNEYNLKKKLNTDLALLRKFDNNQKTNILIVMLLVIFIIASYMVVLTYKSNL